MTLPARLYGDPERILLAKEQAVEHQLKGCKGCSRLSFDASGDRIVANCGQGRKVGRKGKCSLWKEGE